MKTIFFGIGLLYSELMDRMLRAFRGTFARGVARILVGTDRERVEEGRMGVRPAGIHVVQIKPFRS